MPGLGEQPTNCSVCRTDEVREWLDGALPELSSKKRQVIRSLYNLENVHYPEWSGHKKPAVKLRL